MSPGQTRHLAAVETEAEKDEATFPEPHARSPSFFPPLPPARAESARPACLWGPSLLLPTPDHVRTVGLPPSSRTFPSNLCGWSARYVPSLKRCLWERYFYLWRFPAAFTWPSCATATEKLGVCSGPFQAVPSESSCGTEGEKYFHAAKVRARCPDTSDIRAIPWRSREHPKSVTCVFEQLWGTTECLGFSSLQCLRGRYSGFLVHFHTIGLPNWFPNQVFAWSKH